MEERMPVGRLQEIAQRWAFPGHHFGDVTPEQVEDVKWLTERLKDTQKALHRLVAVVESGDPAYNDDDECMGMIVTPDGTAMRQARNALAALDESEVRG